MTFYFCSACHEFFDKRTEATDCCGVGVYVRTVTFRQLQERGMPL